MVTIFAGAFMTSALINFDMFQSYFYQSRFFVSASEDQSGFNDNSLTEITVNILKQPFIAINLLLSGLILAKFMPSAKHLATWNTVVLVMVIIFFIPHAFLSCSDNIQAEYGSYLNYYCNSRCNCQDEATFSPVCTQIGQQTYFSPCHAGCSSIQLLNGIKVIVAKLFYRISRYAGLEMFQIYQNCTCGSNVHELISTQATEGSCNSNSCALSWVVAQASFVLSSGLLATTIVPHIMIILRCVRFTEKAVALGLQLTFTGILPFVPFKIIYNVVAGIYI